MDDIFQKGLNTLDFFVVLAYTRFQPAIDRTKEYFEGIYTTGRHPIATYIVYRQEKTHRLMDSYERNDFKVRQQRNQPGFLQ